MLSARFRAIAATPATPDPPSGSLPPAPLHAAPAELLGWLRRLHETAADLSRRIADQEERLDRLTGLLEAAGERPAAAPAHHLVTFPTPGPAPRWRRLAGRLLRAPGKVLHRLKGAAQSHWILPIADEAAPPPRLRLGEEVLAIERNCRLADLPAGYLELALRVLASENLSFLKLRGRTETAGDDLELWLCRREWPWRTAADLERPLSPLPAGTGSPLLGRRLLLDGDPHSGRTPALAGIEVRSDYWLRPGAPAGLELRARLGRRPGAGAAPLKTGTAPLTAIVLTRPLDGGLEALVAAALRALRAGGREAVLASTFDLRASHRSLAEVAPREIPLYPLATFAAPELRAAHLARLLEDHGADTLIHIGPGEGFFDQPALQELLRGCRVIDLPLPLLPGSPIVLGRPPGVVDLTLDPAAGDFPLPIAPGQQPGASRGAAARQAARERLGVPAEAFLVCQMADLVAGERPEDLVELAVRCPQFFFLQVGRGGLAGRRDDLQRFRGVANLRCLAGADLGELLAAADVLLALGEPSLWPWPVFAALAAGVPVVGRAAGPLARLASGMHVARSLTEIALALEQLAAGAAPRLAPPAAGAPAASGSFEADLGRRLA